MFRSGESGKWPDHEDTDLMDQPINESITEWHYYKVTEIRRQGPVGANVSLGVMIDLDRQLDWVRIT